MFEHSVVHLELARQRQQNLLAAAERRRHLTEADDHPSRRPVRGSSGAATEHSRRRRRWEEVLGGGNHFAHREADGVVVDLFWEHKRLENAFRVEVGDKRAGTHFVLHPITGGEAIQAFYHPFAAAEAASYDREAQAA
jgi:hypothetical protein